jgi:hypothetical protein
MIKVSHEVPLCFLEESLKFNDYDYCLPHLMDQYEEYKNFFLKSKENNRHIMMDNSLHELGVPYTKDRLLHWLYELQPNEFFVPDYWEDKTKSLVSAKEWINVQKSFPDITFIAVVQAKNVQEALECYQSYKDLGYKKIAFSYGASYYNELCPHPNKDLGKALGRIQVICQLDNWGIIGKKDKIHLLGCSIPQEFGWYKNLPYIESLDTSNPIMAGAEGTKYSNNGLYEKPKMNMNTCFDSPYYHFDDLAILHNVLMFKKINNL